MKMRSRYMIIALFSIAAVMPPGYTITGTAPGLPDGTWIYVSQGSKASRIDSCQVMHGAFYMKGRIADTALVVILQTNITANNYKRFWLQNTDIAITCKDGNLKQAEISGSVMDEEEKQLEACTTPLSKQEWIKQHPHSLYAAFALRMNAKAWGPETTRDLYNYLSEEIKASPFGQHVKDYMQLHRNMAVGDRYVDFEQPNTTGQPVKLSQVKGKYTLLEFWSSMCGGCIQGNPKLVKTYNRYKEKGFVVVGVSVDFNKTAWLKAIAKDNLPWENLCDLRGNENRAALMYGITQLPSNFLIDDKGIIVARDLYDDALEQRLGQLLP
jgi:peroxiredoxin